MQAVVLGQEDWLQLLLPHGQPWPCLCVWGGGSNNNPHYFKYDYFLSHQSWDFTQNDMKSEHAYLWRREKRDVTNNLLKHKSKSEEGDQYVNLKDVALSRDTGKVPKWKLMNLESSLWSLSPLTDDMAKSYGTELKEKGIQYQIFRRVYL